MLTLFYGAAGTGKSYAMMDKIKQDAENSKRICVIVPDQFTFEYEHMLYNHIGCRLFNNGSTEVWSFSRLTADIFRKTHAPEGMAADMCVKTAVMYRVIKEAAANDGLLYFAKQAKRPSFVNTAMTMLSELVHSKITPSALGELLKTAPENMHDKLTDLFLIYSRFTAELDKLDMRDCLFDTKLAAEFAVQGDYFSGMSLYFDEFKSFTGDQYAMIGTMLSQADDITVCMTTDDPQKIGYGPFTAVNETCAKLFTIAHQHRAKTNSVEFSENKRYKSEDIAWLSTHMMRLPTRKFTGNSSAVTVVTAPDIYAECSFICSKIKEITASDKSVKYKDIAVLSRAMNDDIAVLSTHFERYEIPFYSDKKPSAAHKPLMLMITSALELAAGKNLSTETVWRYAKSGLTDVSYDDICKLENYCYTWDIDGKTWLDEFPNAQIEAIKNALIQPILTLKKSCHDKTGTQICSAIRKFIGQIRAEDKLLNFKGKHITEAENAVLIRENERLCGELDGILSSLELSLPNKISLTDFREIFMLCAAQITLASPPDALDGVLAQQSDLARLTNPKIVFVMHANDGIFPFATGESTTFSEREREFFKSVDFDLSGSMKKRMAEERFNAFKAICSPSEQLYISYSTADTSGSAVYPSMYIQAIGNILPNAQKINTDNLDMLFFCRTEQSAYTAAAENFDKTNEDFVTVQATLSANPVYKKRFGYIEAIDIRKPHKISDPMLMRKLYGDTLEVSASRFEDFEKCPFMYYCKTGLRLYPLSRMDLNPINQGNIMHYCMKTIFEKNPKEKFLQMSKEDFSASIKKSAQKYISEEFKGSFAKKKSFEFYLDIMNDTLLTALSHMQEEMKASSFVPSGFELPVGVKMRDADKSQLRPIIIECGENLRINFTGTADRVDEFTDENGVKYIRIIDYKTGFKEFIAEQLALGINMQMFFYLFTLTDENGGRYEGAVPAGVLYMPVKYPSASNDRQADYGSISKCIEDTLKMQGAVLDSALIINAMEKDCCGKFIPVSFNKNGTISAKSSVIDSDVMNGIKELSKRLLQEMGKAVFEGNVPASPFESKKLKCTLPCEYCDYKDICGNYPNPVLRDISDVDMSLFEKE